MTADEIDGYRQAIEFLDVIIALGQGQSDGDDEIPLKYQNTADGLHEPDCEPNPAGRKSQKILARYFANFITIRNDVFQGKPYHGFGASMAKFGGEILSCWQHNAVPKFS
jgi:hypothetical protein